MSHANQQLIDAATQHRQRMAERSRNQSAAVADVGEIPPVVNPDRRKACERDLHLFLTTYFPATTGLRPFSEDHRRAITRIEQCALEGGRFVQAFPRGFAKTTISENAVLWAVLFGHRQFVPIFGADANSAAGNIDSIKMELSENDLLYEDFPEVCHPIRALEGKPQRCSSQTFEGTLTHIEWRVDTIVLPTIPNSKASGAIVTTRGIEGGARGMKHKRPDGTQQRPDFAIIDDPQTDGSAASPVQVVKRLNVVRKSILKLGGHSRQMAVVMNATVIQPDDMVEQLLDPKKFPAWQGERIKMVRKWADSHETLWLGDYARIRNTYDPEVLGDQRRAHQQATEFYKINRGLMDGGCAVAWDECYDRDTELSAIQHAYNALIDDGPEVFASECQNEPFRIEEDEHGGLTADQIAEKVNGLTRGAVDVTASHVVAFIDVQKVALFYTVMAFSDDFTGSVIDYGTWPDQKRAYFTLREIKRTIQGTVKVDGFEAQLYAALDSLTNDLLGKEWKRGDGASLRIERLAIDANWGDSTNVVYQFCRQSPHSAILVPSHGIGVKATSTPFDLYKAKPGERKGFGWRLMGAKNARGIRYLAYDTNRWKSFSDQRLATPMGAKGCVSLFGQPGEAHKMFADHQVAEAGTQVEAKGRTVTEWTLRKPGLDNHFKDAFVGCHVLASMQGASVTGEIQRAKAKIKLSEIQKRKQGRA